MDITSYLETARSCFLTARDNPQATNDSTKEHGCFWVEGNTGICMFVFPEVVFSMVKKLYGAIVPNGHIDRVNAIKASGVIPIIVTKIENGRLAIVATGNTTMTYRALKTTSECRSH